jgi:16S rRNA (cytidine1402-2'-O)-methyltransferase
MVFPETTEKQRAWLLPAAKTGKPTAGLYIVSTPIGNLGDITLRALDLLAACDLVVCEDTRVSGKLLQHYGIKKPLLSYNDHNADRQRGGVLKKIAQGQCVALISDAGTPLISDPGFKLARECAGAGYYVTSLPGANAVLTALQLSGLATDSFCFGGFLPPKSEARKKELARWMNVPATLVFFETAPRLSKALADIADVMGERPVSVLRELTKLYEERRSGTAVELMAFYEKNNAPKGEIVLVIGKGEAAIMDDKAVEKELRQALKTMTTKEAARHVTALSGRSKKDLYALALELGDES